MYRWMSLCFIFTIFWIFLSLSEQQQQQKKELWKFEIFFYF